MCRQEAAGCDNEIKEYREHQQELAGQLEDRQLNVQQLQSNADSLDGDVDRLYETKQKVSRGEVAAGATAKTERSAVFLIGSRPSLPLA